MSITTAKKKFDPKAAGAHPKAVRATVVEHLATPTAGAFIQRTPGCACGGGCPRCQGEPGLQPKLNIGQPNDKYEQEADQVADHVMRMAAPDIQQTPPYPLQQVLRVLGAKDWMKKFCGHRRGMTACRP